MKKQEYTLEVKNIKKYYEEIKAVNGITFSVPKGSFYAFLGENGAGKSTTIQCISSLSKPDSGDILINSQSDSNYIRSHIGIVFQENVLDDMLTVKENLLTRGSLYIRDTKTLKERYQYLLELLYLDDIEDQKFMTLSGGEKRRVEIARALFSDPELLILDEPTTGLDPEARRLVWDIIFKLQKDNNLTVFLTTHYMEEASNADYILIIDKGKIIAEGSPTDLKMKYSKDLLKITPKDENKFLNYLSEKSVQYLKQSNQYHVIIHNHQDAITILQETRDNIKSFELVNGSIDDVFLEVVGK